MTDRTFKKIIRQLTGTRDNTTPHTTASKSTQTEPDPLTNSIAAISMNQVDRDEGAEENGKERERGEDAVLDREEGVGVEDNENEKEDKEKEDEDNENEKEDKEKGKGGKQKEESQKKKKQKQKENEGERAVDSDTDRRGNGDLDRRAKERNENEAESERAVDSHVDRQGDGDLGRRNEEMDQRERELTEEGLEEDLLEYYERTKNSENDEIVATDGTYSLINKCLYFSDRKTASLRLCVPEPLIEEILQLCHDKRGHPGIRHTYSSVALRFYFPRMSRQVKQYLAKCPRCQLAKPSHEKPPGLMQSIESPTEPCHTISIDFVTGLPISHGYDALLTVTDTFSKAVRLIACNKTTTAEDIDKLFLMHCYPTFGLPYKIISDRDARFTSKFWRP
jgi:hypothetical protein